VVAGGDQAAVEEGIQGQYQNVGGGDILLQPVPEGGGVGFGFAVVQEFFGRGEQVDGGQIVQAVDEIVIDRTVVQGDVENDGWVGFTAGERSYEEQAAEQDDYDMSGF
jgi:hypothetical protein